MNGSSAQQTARPVWITAVAFLFIAAGIVGLIYHSKELFEKTGFINYQALWVLFLRVLAVITGMFMLRGANWARWSALAWMAYHGVLGMYHSLTETLIHFGLLIVIAVLLLHPKSSAFFRH